MDGVELDNVDLGSVDISGIDLGDIDLGDVDVGSIDTGSALDDSPSALSAGVDRFQSGIANFAKGPGSHEDWWNRPIGELVGIQDPGEAHAWSKEFEKIAVDNWNEYKKFTPEVASVKDIETGGQLVDYIGENLALGAPQIASLFLGPTGLALIGAEATGTTMLEQEEAGEKVNFGRAMATGTVEAMLNLPLGKAAGALLKTVDKTKLDEVAKKNLTKDLVLGITTDVGLNGVQQIVRNYGVEGKFSTENIEEALVGGLLISAPIRGAGSISDTVLQDKLAKSNAEYAVKTGDIETPDKWYQKVNKFMVGRALDPVKRIQEIPEGAELLKSFDEMAITRDVVAAEYTTRVDDLMKRVGSGKKKQDKFFEDYSAGRRDTQELVELNNIMNSVWQRGNNPEGANMGFAYIHNFLPTVIDAKTFGEVQVKDMSQQYTSWYKNIMDSYKHLDNESGVKVRSKLVSPKKAYRLIKDYQKTIQNEKAPSVKLPKIDIDDDGNFITKNPVQGRAAKKDSSLDYSRMLGFIPQEIMSQFAVRESMPEQIKQYLYGASQRITYAEQMGKNNEKLNTRIGQVGQQLKGTGKEFTRTELDTIYGTLDAYQGLYKQFQDETFRQAASAIRKTTNIVALPLSGLSSLTELFNLSIKVGNVEAGKALIKAFSTMAQDFVSNAFSTASKVPGLKVLDGLVPPSEVNKQLRLTYRSMSSASTALSNRLTGDHQRGMSKTGLRQLTSLTSWSAGFFHITGQTTINYLVNSMAAHAAAGQVKNDIMIVNGYSGSKLAQEATARLNAVGISASQFKAFHSNPKQLDRFMPEVVARFNRDVALHPEALDKPLWMSTGWGSMFAQLRSYPTMFTNTILPKFLPLLKKNGRSNAEMARDTADALSTIGAIIFVGFLQETIKDEFKGTDTPEEEIFMKGVMNTIAPMQASYAVDVATGRITNVFSPASASILDVNLQKALKGEDYDVTDVPVLSSLKGVM